MEKEEIMFTVHWPSGPVTACYRHKEQLVALSQLLGCHVGVTLASDESPCANCVNEQKAAARTPVA